MIKTAILRRALLPIFVVAMAGGTGCDGPSHTRPAGSASGGVFALEDYFAEGERRVEHALADPAHAGLREALTKAERAVVRVRVDHSRVGSTFSSNHGSGVLVGDRRHVLTVAHVLTSLTSKQGATIAVRFADGTEIAATAAPGWEQRLGDRGLDWAVLKLAEDAPVEPLPLVGESGPAADTVLLLGYPARIGRRPGTGRVVQDDPAQRSELLALRIVGRLTTDGSDHFLPLHGSIPLAGVSGGAVVDEAGRVVAIERAINESVDGDTVHRTLDVVPMQRFRDELRTLGVPLGE